MERLLELYKEVSQYPKTCNLSQQQKGKVFVFMKEFNKHLTQKHSSTICNRYPVIRHAERFLKAHGLI